MHPSRRGAGRCMGLSHQPRGRVRPHERFHTRHLPSTGRRCSDMGRCLPEVNSRLRGRIAVCHTPFDRVAVARACDRSKVEGCECRWLDSARVVRRAWPEFAKSGSGLRTWLLHFGIPTMPTMPLRCPLHWLALLRAIADTGLTLSSGSRGWSSQYTRTEALGMEQHSKGRETQTGTCLVRFSVSNWCSQDSALGSGRRC